MNVNVINIYKAQNTNPQFQSIISSYLRQIFITKSSK